MKQKIKPIIFNLIIITAIILTGCTSIDESLTKPTEITIEDIAKSLQYHFVNDTLTDTIFNTIFNDTIKAQTNPIQLEYIWTQITNNYGDFIKITNIKITQELGYNIVYLTCEYTKLGVLDTRIVFDDNNLIAGLQFVPTDISDQYQPPTYVNTQNFTENNVTIGNNTQWELPGTLTMPIGNGPFPAVILVHGSGPNDRDETIGPNKPFKDLAWGLATNGIAVLRYEKRTKYYATTIINQLNNLTIYDETTEDALNAVTFLKTNMNIDNTHIYLIGHSLGGMLAPQIANQTTDLNGIILMAAPTRPLEDLIINQTFYLLNLDGIITDEEQKQIDQIQENVTKIKTLTISTNEIILGAGLAYWESLANYNPVATALTLDIPMLILQGKRDYQVLYEIDFFTWQTAFNENTNVNLIAYDLLNHLFISGNGTPTNVEYNDPGNIHEAVITDISTWIMSHLSG
jgi:esterase/lipase